MAWQPIDEWGWEDIAAEFGYYPPALADIAAGTARPTYQNIRAVENPYRRGGYDPPALLIDWLWGRYYEEIPRQLPGQIGGFVGDYGMIILLAVGAFLVLKK